jgi:hypothetical protein
VRERAEGDVREKRSHQVSLVDIYKDFEHKYDNFARPVQMDCNMKSMKGRGQS